MTSILLNSVKNDLSSLNKTVSNLSGDYKQQRASELAAWTTECDIWTSWIYFELARLKNNVTSELAGLQSRVTSELAGHGQSSVTSELSGLATQFPPSPTQKSWHKSLLKWMHLIPNWFQLMLNVLYSSPLFHTNTSLISHLLPLSPISLPSSPVFTCGGTGGWRRVVYLTFTDPNTPCPSGWGAPRENVVELLMDSICDSVSVDQRKID